MWAWKYYLNWSVSCTNINVKKSTEEVSEENRNWNCKWRKKNTRQKVRYNHYQVTAGGSRNLSLPEKNRKKILSYSLIESSCMHIFIVKHNLLVANVTLIIISIFLSVENLPWFNFLNIIQRGNTLGSQQHLWG